MPIIELKCIMKRFDIHFNTGCIQKCLLSVYKNKLLDKFYLHIGFIRLKFVEFNLNVPRPLGYTGTYIGAASSCHGGKNC